MKFASLVLSGFLLVVLAGCGSSDSGRVNQLTDDLAQAQEDLDAAEAARLAAEGERDTARNTLQTTQGLLTTTRTELDETTEDLETAEGDRDAAQDARDAAQADANAQRERAEAQEQEEADAESVQRAYGLLEAMDEGFRGTLSTDATNINRDDAATKLGMTHPLDNSEPERPRISNNAPTIRESASGSLQLTVWSDAGKSVPEFTPGGGIPSLSMGGSSLSSRLFERNDPLDNAEELAVFTDFSARNVRLLDDLYTDYRRWVIAGTNETVTTITPASHTETNEIQMAGAIANPAVAANVLTDAGNVDVNEKMRDGLRTLNDGMYGSIPEVPALQPRLSGVTFEASSYTLRDNVDNSDYTVLYELADDMNTPETDDDEYNIVKRFPAALRGVTGWVQFRGATFDPGGPNDGPDGILSSDGDVCTASPTPAICVTQAATLTPVFTVVTRPRGTSTNPVTYEPTSYAISGTGEWTFLPSSAGARVWVDDGHYMHFGWWQVTPDQADGVYDYHVFADGMGRWGAMFANRENTNQPYSLDTQSDVVYTGPAVGKYVRTVGAHDELDHAGERRREAVAGIFTANARLEADFTAGTPGTGTVEGTITNFVDDGSGDVIPGRWQVILGDVGTGTRAMPPNVVPATNISFTGTGSDIPGTAIAVIKQIGQGGGQGSLPDEDQTGRQLWEVIFLADELSGPLTLSGQPSVPAAAVGRFDVGLRGVIHFSGAFGVTKN